jgi:ADP-heptose:LPS heptosyltransferase
MRKKTSNKIPETILVLRFSALGDVAMIAAALREFAAAHRNLSFIMVSQPFMRPLFKDSANVSFIEADIHGVHRGLRGLWRLFRELYRVDPCVVVDLHDVLRTKILRLLFRFCGFKVEKIDKGRQEKQQLIRRWNKKVRPLKTMLHRYAETLSAAVGEKWMNFNATFIPLHTARNGSIKKIGVAPFAKYKGKNYPLKRMEKIVAYFAGCKDVKVYLFGGGKKEVEILSDWERKYPDVVSLAGRMPLSGELEKLSELDVMLSMDSANMHLASFSLVPVVSIWGATHPFAGFTGWKQMPTNNIQLHLTCRPCSVFGKKPCYRKNYACMDIPEEIIIKKVKEVIGQKIQE